MAKNNLDAPAELGEGPVRTLKAPRRKKRLVKQARVGKEPMPAMGGPKMGGMGVKPGKGMF